MLDRPIRALLAVAAGPALAAGVGGIGSRREPVVVVSRRDRAAAGLLAPYLIWSLFATTMTIVEDPAIVGPKAAPR